MTPNNGRLRFDRFTVDCERKVLLDGDEQILTGKPAGVLCLLVSRADRIITREEILNDVWGRDADPANLDQAIRRIRKTLGDDSKQPRFVQTVYGEGFRFIGAIAVPVPQTVHTDQALRQAQGSQAPSRPA